jgi:N-methylhydantoinase A
MEAEGLRLLKKAGVRPEEITFTRIVGARYVGQGYEIEIPVPVGDLTSQSLQEIQQSFNTEYLRFYNRLNEGMEIEFIDWRVLVSGREPSLNIGGESSPSGQMDGPLKGHREVYFSECNGYVRAAIYDRYGLQMGNIIEGPAVVEEKESTLVIGPSGKAEVDTWGNIIVTLE